MLVSSPVGSGAQTSRLLPANKSRFNQKWVILKWISCYKYPDFWILLVLRDKLVWTEPKTNQKNARLDWAEASNDYLWTFVCFFQIRIKPTMSQNDDIYQKNSKQSKGQRIEISQSWLKRWCFISLLLPFPTVRWKIPLFFLKLHRRRVWIKLCSGEQKKDTENRTFSCPTEAGEEERSEVFHENNM